MKIFQISDLHIDEHFDKNVHQDMIEKMIEKINYEMKYGEYGYIVCCGDIVNRGVGNEYRGKAKEIFDYIKSNINEDKLDFLFVPGNHDLCEGNFDQLQKFIQMYNKKIDFLSNNVILYEGKEIDFLLINSCYHKDYKYGKVDIKELNNIVKRVKRPTVVVMHHTVFSRYSDDRSEISDAYKFFEILESNNIIGVLHGHTHGYSNVSIGSKCRVIGCGSIFEYINNCNNQFNVIDIQLEMVEKITNNRYISDLEDFEKILLFENKKRNIILESKASDVYQKVKKLVKHCGGINNLYMNINSCISDYKHDMLQNFSMDIEAAKLWLNEDVPSLLYYNHGCYMRTLEIQGIDYVVEELVRNSTSNRAIIPLIHFNDVLKNRSGHLPGLSSIQFGFTNDEKTELYCSVYLRSLEVNHFFRINLSEIYLLIFNLCDRIRSVRNVNISIYAFKAQYKENFSCFRKAKIDTLTPGELSSLIYGRKLKEIIDLFKDKFDMEETVINTNGLEGFYDIFEKSCLYPKNLIDELNMIIQDMNNLHKEYLKSSNYDKIKPIEKEMHNRQESFIKLISRFELL